MRTCSPFPSSVILLLCSLFIPTFVAGCGSSTPRRPGRPDPGTGNEATVSFQLSDRKLIAVDVSVNEQTGTFLLIPSFNHTVLLPHGSIRGSVTDNENRPSEPGKTNTVTLRNVRVGSFTTPSLVATRLRKKQLSSFSSVLQGQDLSSYDGVLGYNFLRQTQLTIHYPDRQLHLRELSPSSAVDSTNGVEQGKIPFERTNTSLNRSVITLETGVNGTYEARMAIDTSFPINLLDDSYRKKWSLNTLSEEKMEERFGASNSKFDFVEINRLWVGGRTFQNPVFRIEEQLQERLGLNAQGIMGFLFLRDKILRINFPRRWIIIRSASSQTDE